MILRDSGGDAVLRYVADLLKKQSFNDIAASTVERELLSYPTPDNSEATSEG
jgi:hypothetical protein